MARMSYDPASLRRRAEHRVGQLPRRLVVEPEALHGKRILEVGCGNGECTAVAAEMFGADAWGIDIEPRWIGGPYDELGRQGRLLLANACEPAELEPLGQFDYVQSYTVFEHIDRPREALETIYRMLKPGGRAFISLNLHLGASAGHLMGYLPDMPWIHLTHTDEEARALMLARHKRDRGISWVNKLTDQDYIEHCGKLGFVIHKRWYKRVWPEDDFYERHKDKLGQYSKDQLSKNFMNLTLEKPAG